MPFWSSDYRSGGEACNTQSCQKRTFRIEGIKIFWEHGGWNDLMLICWSQEKFHREGDIESEVIPESFQAKGDVVRGREQCLYSVFSGIFGFTTFHLVCP